MNSYCVIKTYKSVISHSKLKVWHWSGQADYVAYLSIKAGSELRSWLTMLPALGQPKTWSNCKAPALLTLTGPSHSYVLPPLFFPNRHPVIFSLLRSSNAASDIFGSAAHHQPVQEWPCSISQNLLSPAVPQLLSPSSEEAVCGVREGFGSGCFSEPCGGRVVMAQK